MKYIVLLISLFLSVFLNAVEIKAKGFAVVRIIKQEDLISSDDLLENIPQYNYQVYSYIVGNTINFVF